MRRGQEKWLDTARGEQIPGERLDAELILRKSGKLRMDRSERLARRALRPRKSGEVPASRG